MKKYMYTDLPDHGHFCFTSSTDKFCRMSKKRLAGMVAEVYEGSEEKHLITIEYWMTFPKIALIAIIGDTYLDGK